MAEQSRQLAAIMFTDIVGYTALMGKDENKEFDLLNTTGKSRILLMNKIAKMDKSRARIII